MAKTFTDYPKAASTNAQRAIDYKERTGDKGGCGTQVGWVRARQLANREPISLETVKRMANFGRFERYKDDPYEDENGKTNCGRIMWDAWGGTQGVAWAKKTVEREERENNMMNYDILTDIESYDYGLQKVSAFLKEADGEPVNINVASNGGDVFEGLKIAGLIRDYKGDTQVSIYGLAASIATIIALAANRVRIAKFSMFMIHNSWTGMGFGDKEELAKQANTLESIDKLLLSVYVNKVQMSGKLINNSVEETEAYFKELMDKETFLSSEEALELGLVDEVISDENTNASLRLTAQANIRQKATYSNKLPNQFYNGMEDKKTFLQQALAFLGLGKAEAQEVLNALPEPQNAGHESDEKDAPKDEKKEDMEGGMEDKMKAMEEKMKAMEEKMKDLEAMYEEEKEEKEEAKASLQKLQEEAANGAPFKSANNSTNITSALPPEIQAKLNAGFQKIKK